jgi:3-phenylpropionate/trans-cinnamate dioxygenase ferredoxin reductase subunit
MQHGVVIVGAGHGGSQAAVSLRQQGYNGPLTLLTDEADVPYHKPPLSKTFLRTPEAAPSLLRAESTYASNNIALRLDTSVASIDLHGRRLVLRGGDALPFDRLVLATGARARRLTLPGRDLAGVFYLRSAHDARALRSALADATSVVVIGGGFVGLEAAACLAGMGKQVAVIEAVDRLLARVVAPAMSDYMARLHRSLGIRLLTGTGVERIDGDTRVTSVLTTGGERLAADMVIVGIGAEPNVELAAAAGITCDNGIVVAADLQTSVPDVYAIGDCAAYHHWQAGHRLRLESVQNATDHARHVARSILGHKDDYREVPWFWSDQGPAKLQMTGLAVGADRQVVSGSIEDHAFSIYHFQGQRLLAVDSVNRPADHMLGRKMLAAGFSPDDALIKAGPAAMKAAVMGEPDAARGAARR